MDRKISLKAVLAAVGALVLLGGTFYAGMAFENHRIEKEFERAFAGWGEGGDEDIEAFGESSEEQDAGEPTELEQVELKEGASAEFVDTNENDEEGLISVTLKDVELESSDGLDSENPELTRIATLQVRVKNIGDVPTNPRVAAWKFITAEGQVVSGDEISYSCDVDLPYDEIQPGQFVDGCVTAYLPDDAGQLVVDESGGFQTYVKIDAA